MKLLRKITNPKIEAALLLIVAAAFGFSAYVYQHVGERIVTHWNFAGQPDGYSGKAFGVFLLPAMMLVMYVLFLALPLLDPHRERYTEFARAYHLLRSSILLVLLGIGVAAGVYNLGYQINIGTVVSLLVGLLFVCMGVLMRDIKMNWFIGIRTPWTLSSEKVWNKTHKVGGILMVLCGLCIMATPYLPQPLGIALFILSILSFSVGSIVYSYLLYRREKT